MSGVQGRDPSLALRIAGQQLDLQLAPLAGVPAVVLSRGLQIEAAAQAHPLAGAALQEGRQVRGGKGELGRGSAGGGGHGQG
jgi:hypothetical protein